MENGILSPSPTSSAPESTASTNSIQNAAVNGFAHPRGFREKILNKERQALLEERRQILSGEDPILLEEVRFINEQMEEQKQMLINKMGRHFNWINERCKEDLVRLQEEEKAESGGLKELMYNQLEKLKDGLEDKISQIDMFDKRTLSVLRLGDKEVNLEPTAPDEEENGCESPTNAILERQVCQGRLIGDSDIKDDLIQLNQSTTPTDFEFHEVARPRIRYKVILDRCRLIYDGKTFYRGQKLFVQTTNYTRFPAIIYALADEYAHIRSRTPGDTREVYATLDDLRSGRVKIGRKIMGGHEGPEGFDPQSP